MRIKALILHLHGTGRNHLHVLRTGPRFCGLNCTVFFHMQGVLHEDLFLKQWAIHSIGPLIWIVVNIRLNHTAFFLACRCEGTHPATSRTVKSS